MLIHKMQIYDISIIKVYCDLVSITIHFPLRCIIKFLSQLLNLMERVFLIVLHNLYIKMSNAVLMLFQ